MAKKIKQRSKDRPKDHLSDDLVSACHELGAAAFSLWAESFAEDPHTPAVVFPLVGRSLVNKKGVARAVTFAEPRVIHHHPELIASARAKRVELALLSLRLPELDDLLGGITCAAVPHRVQASFTDFGLELPKGFDHERTGHLLVGAYLGVAGAFVLTATCTPGGAVENKRLVYDYVDMGAGVPGACGHLPSALPDWPPPAPQDTTDKASWAAVLGLLPDWAALFDDQEKLEDLDELEQESSD